MLKTELNTDDVDLKIKMVQYPVTNHNGKGYEKEYIYRYIYIYI